MERKKLTPSEAETVLAEGDPIHTFRSSESGPLIGADWPREKILHRFKTHGVELAGESARKIGHGLASKDDLGWLFIETKRT